MNKKRYTGCIHLSIRHQSFFATLASIIAITTLLSLPLITLRVSADSSLDISQVQITPTALSDVANWPETTAITVSDTGDGGVTIDFDKKASDTGWPKQYSSAEQPMPGIGIGDAINHTVWVFRNVGGQWYGTGVLQALGNYNDPTGTLANIPCGGLNNVPQMNPTQNFKVGEQIAFMVTAGSERGTIVTTVKERSNIQLYTVAADNLTGRDPTCGSGNSSSSSQPATKPPNNGPIPKSQDFPVPNQGLPTDLGQLISAIFVWSLSIIGLVIFVRFFYAGFKWAFLSAGNSAQVGEAKNMMKNAVYGAIVLFSAFLILNTINPDLVGSVVNLPGIPATNPTAGTTPSTGSGGPSGGGTTVQTPTSFCVNYVCSTQSLQNAGQPCGTEADCGGVDKKCQYGYCTNTGEACTSENQCNGTDSSYTPATCIGRDDAGNGVCSDNPDKTCQVDIDCVPDSSVNGSGIPSTCVEKDVNGNGTCSDNQYQRCQIDSDCGN